eukprot:scaffold73750_cov63-Phaeocystis_antarctica.AAC.3
MLPQRPRTRPASLAVAFFRREDRLRTVARVVRERARLIVIGSHCSRGGRRPRAQRAARPRHRALHVRLVVQGPVPTLSWRVSALTKLCALAAPRDGREGFASDGGCHSRMILVARQSDWVSTRCGSNEYSSLVRVS